MNITIIFHWFKDSRVGRAVAATNYSINLTHIRAQYALSAATLPINWNLKFVVVADLFSKIVALWAGFVRLFAWEAMSVSQIDPRTEQCSLRTPLLRSF